MTVAAAHDTADVIVVGAGPAGAVSALLLARAGYDVRLLERRAWPRPKPCGDCISAGANAVLDRLGLRAAVCSLPHAELRGWRIIAPSGACFAADFTSPRHAATSGDTDHALSVERRLFDATLVQAAIDAGARFQPLTHVTSLVRDHDGHVCGVLARAARLHARLIIGADGLRSVVAQRLHAVARRPRLRKLSLTVHVDRRLTDEPVGEMHVGAGLCVGIAPVTRAGGRCNVTVVAAADRYGRVAAEDARAFLLWAAESLPRVRGRIASTDLTDTAVLASGPFDRPTRRTVFDGAALVGDAAGYYDPFTGQGVYQALATAELLAHVAADALRSARVTSHSLARYASGHTQLLRAPRLVQRGIEHVLARPALADRAIARIARAPAFAHALLGVTGDLESATRLLSPHALSSLLLPRR